MSLEYSADNYREMGWKLLNENKFRDAVSTCDKGLAESPKHIGLLCCRSAAYLKLEDYDNSLVDAESILQLQPTSADGNLNKVRALVGLRKYREAEEFLENCDNDSTGEGNASQSELAEFKLKIKDQLNGVYNMEYFMKNVDMDSKSFPDCVEYIGPIKVAEVPGKGRGYIAGEPINAGQLIMACKAVAMAPSGTKDSQDGSGVQEHSIDLALLIMKRLEDDKRLKKDLLGLFAGPNYSVYEVAEEIPEDEEYVVDLNRVIAICRYNAFNIDPENGLWIAACFFNHGCVCINTWTIILKDFIFIRAICDISPGQEVLVNYISPFLTFEKRERILREMDFECDCQLCRLERSESAETHQTRADILRTVKSFPKKAVFPNEKLEELKQLIGRLKELRADEKFNFPLFKAQNKLLSHCTAGKRFDTVAKMMKRRYHLTYGLAADDLALQCMTKTINALAKAKMAKEYNGFLTQMKDQLRIHFGNENIDMRILNFYA